MAADVVGRDRELRLMRSLLEDARAGPSVLILDGPAGIGKTTLCRAIGRDAARSGFAVLTATGAAAEVSLSWSGLGDLIGGIDNAALADLSVLHQQALQTVATDAGGKSSDERLLGAAFRAALTCQAKHQPVLLVIDDAQWLDEASKLILGFAVRRLVGRVAVVVSFRTGDPRSVDPSWAKPTDPATLTRLTVGPLNKASVTSLVDARMGRKLPGAAMARIHALAQGNPFFALELTRALGDDPVTGMQSLPPTLAALVRDRIGDLSDGAAEILVTAAVAFEPTVDVVASATGRSVTDVIEVLAPMECRGILGFDGPRIRFSHPLIASGVVAEATPAVRRHAHRRLAETVSNAEQRARHLALSSPHSDPETLGALDMAAEAAAARGTYSAAAELAGLAIRHGGDTHLRRLRAAEFLFRAGALDEADALLAPIIEDLPGGMLRTLGLLLVAAVRGYRDGLASTIGMLERAVSEAGENLVLRTPALIVLALSVGIGGDMDTCVEYARRARADAAVTGLAPLHSQALTLSAHVGFLYGLGTDFDALREAEALGEPDAFTPIMLCPRPIRALHWAWTGRLEEARSRSGRGGAALRGARQRTRFAVGCRAAHHDRRRPGPLRRCGAYRRRGRRTGSLDRRAVADDHRLHRGGQRGGPPGPSRRDPRGRRTRRRGGRGGPAGLPDPPPADEPGLRPGLWRALLRRAGDPAAFAGDLRSRPRHRDHGRGLPSRRRRGAHRNRPGHPSGPGCWLPAPDAGPWRWPPRAISTAQCAVPKRP